jgi:filamentous hemagglutinin
LATPQVSDPLPLSMSSSFVDENGILANANNAVIDPRKLTDYALNPSHPVGGDKAIVFQSSLGYDQSNADDLLAQLKQGVTENVAVPGVVDQHGTRFTVDIPVTGPNGNTAMVRTGFIYVPGSNVPHLTTLYVK